MGNSDSKTLAEKENYSQVPSEEMVDAYEDEFIEAYVHDQLAGPSTKAAAVTRLAALRVRIKNEKFLTKPATDGKPAEYNEDGWMKWQAKMIKHAQQLANAAKPVSEAHASPFYNELQNQGMYAPMYAPQPYNYGPQMQLGYAGAASTSALSDYAMLLPLVLLICFLFMAIACVSTIFCGAAGYILGKRPTPQHERKVRNYEV